MLPYRSGGPDPGGGTTAPSTEGETAPGLGGGGASFAAAAPARSGGAVVALGPTLDEAGAAAPAREPSSEPGEVVMADASGGTGTAPGEAAAVARVAEALAGEEGVEDLLQEMEEEGGQQEQQG